MACSWKLSSTLECGQDISDHEQVRNKEAFPRNLHWLPVAMVHSAKVLLVVENSVLVCVSHRALRCGGKSGGLLDREQPFRSCLCDVRQRAQINVITDCTVSLVSHVPLTCKTLGVDCSSCRAATIMALT